MRLFGFVIQRESALESDFDEVYQGAKEWGAYKATQRIVQEQLPGGWFDITNGCYWTGMGARMVRVHERNEQCDISCVIHNPSKHEMSHLPTHWRWYRGIMERICKHGVGHIDPDNLAFIRRTRGDVPAYMESTHSCCEKGCCGGAYSDQAPVAH